MQKAKLGVILLAMIGIGGIIFGIYYYSINKDNNPSIQTPENNQNSKPNNNSNNNDSQNENDNSTNKEEKIIANFLNDIELAKKNQLTEKQNYLLCDETYDCTNIKDFNVTKIELIDTLSNGNEVFEFHLNWTCKTNNECFYVPQYDDEINGVYSAIIYYEVKNYQVINGGLSHWS